MRQSVRGTFTDLVSAQNAIRNLLDAHVPTKDITVIAPKTAETFDITYSNQVVPGAAAGSVIGAVAGAVGATMVAGPAAGVAAMALAGSMVGSVGGAVGGLAWWEHTAKHLETAFADDNKVWVSVGGESASVGLELLRQAGAVDVRSFRDRVQEAGEESFPASDPPSFTR